MKFRKWILMAANRKLRQGSRFLGRRLVHSGTASTNVFVRSSVMFPRLLGLRFKA